MQNHITASAALAIGANPIDLVRKYVNRGVTLAVPSRAAEDYDRQRSRDATRRYRERHRKAKLIVAHNGVR